DLLDLGTRGVGLLADDVDVDRHLAPAIDGIAPLQDLRLDDGAAALLPVEVGARQEDHADRELPGLGLVAGVTDVGLEEFLRDLDMDAGAVAGLAVGIDRAAVPHRLQGVDGSLDHVAPRLAIKRRDEAYAAGVMLLARVIEPGRRKPRGIGAIFRQKALARHQRPPIIPPRLRGMRSWPPRSRGMRVWP